MKKVNVLVLLMAMSVTASFAADKVIKLLKPNTHRSITLMKALSDRKSTREYAVKEISIADLSDVLWAANGVNRSDGKRTAPSAMDRKDVDVYVILPVGAYLYDAKEHKLDLVAEGDYRAAVAGGQDFVKSAPLSLVLVTDLSRLGDAKNLRIQQMGAVDVGIVSQNIALFCAAANLATVPRATMDADQLKRVLNLKETQLPLINHPIGHFK
ncbi:MAG: SagB/ThcOx family dehydrogenase [Mediterranea sp.]|nr:SagB/ThcOx family dehydrogenase [Mediterranea sp.]